MLKSFNKRALLAALAVVFAASVARMCETWDTVRRYNLDFSRDLIVRRNEIACSHEGVNPFNVFDGQVESDGWRTVQGSYSSGPDESGRRPVHAYPPWHTAFFWWYGRVGETALVAFAFLAKLAMLLYSAKWIWRRFTKEEESRKWLAVVGASLIFPVCECLETGNYGIPLVFAVLVLYRCLEERRDLAAGFVWALIMSKPQVGALLFWPLLFQRRYVAICVAAASLALATLWPVRVYGESPVDLVLQVSKAGKPYIEGWIVSPPVVKLFFGHSFEAVAVLFGGACAAACFLVRKAPHWWQKALPVAIAAPWWTYSRAYDEIACWAAPLFLALAFADSPEVRIPRRRRRALFLLFITSQLCRCAEAVHMLAQANGFHGPHGRRIFHYLVLDAQPLCWLGILVVATMALRRISAECENAAGVRHSDSSPVFASKSCGKERSFA